MMKFEVAQLFPDFLLGDRNGYAMAKAISCGLRIMCETVQDGIDILRDVEKMPEWRLDEMAWELNCPYDQNANIEMKRAWIRDAIPLYSVLGTPQAVYNFLGGFFDQVELEEYWQYFGLPFHFRVTVSGEWNEANEAWTRRVINIVKNVRSILDDVAVGSGTTILIHGEGGELARYGPPLTGDGLYAGMYPQENIIGKVMSQVYLVSPEEAKGHRFPYPSAGTRPQENTVGGVHDSRITAKPEAKGHTFPYPATRGDLKTGTLPQENIISKTTEGVFVIATRDTRGHTYPYVSASEESRAGTMPEESVIGKMADGAFIVSTKDAQGHAFFYPQTGTSPEINTIGATGGTDAQTGTDGKATAFSYSPCTGENLCGSDKL